MVCFALASILIVAPVAEEFAFQIVDRKLKSVTSYESGDQKSQLMLYSSACKEKLDRAGLRAEVMGFEIGKSYQFRMKNLTYTETAKRHKFVRVGPKWRYQLTEIVSRVGVGCKTNPTWVGFIYGYPIDGKPDTWTDWYLKP